MATVIETSMWVDFFQPKTPHPVKAQVRAWILQSDVLLCEPVMFEVLRSATTAERPVVERHFNTIPVLPTPPTLWREAALLGQACHDKGLTIGSLDLLIVAICIHHQAEIVSFDADFASIAQVAPVKLKLLSRAT